MTTRRDALILAAVLSCAGCTREAGPPVALPLAVHAPAVFDRSARTLDVTCAADGELWIGKKPVSLESLSRQLSDCQRGAGRIPVAIRADKATFFSNLWGVVKTCYAKYDDRIALAVLNEPNIESQIAFSALPPGDVAACVTLTRTQDGVRINGRAIPSGGLDRTLARLASFDRRMSILIVPGSADSVQDVVALMDCCCGAGLPNIHLLKRSPAVEDVSAAEH